MVGRTGWGTALLTLALGLAGCASTTVDLSGEAPAADPSTASAAAPATAAPTAPTAAPAPAAEQVALANTLRWKTASEVDNFGFDVFRGPSEDGPFERVNSDTIPGAGTVDEPQQYAYVDDTIESGVEYWYYVESISMTGEREQFTPIFKAKAKYVEE